METQKKKSFVQLRHSCIDPSVSKAGTTLLAEVLTQLALFYLVKYFDKTHKILVSSRLLPFCEMSLRTQTKQIIALGEKPGEKLW